MPAASSRWGRRRRVRARRVLMPFMTLRRRGAASPVSVVATIVVKIVVSPPTLRRAPAPSPVGPSPPPVAVVAAASGVPRRRRARPASASRAAIVPSRVRSFAAVAPGEAGETKRRAGRQRQGCVRWSEIRDRRPPRGDRARRRARERRAGSGATRSRANADAPAIWRSRPRARAAAVVPAPARSVHRRVASVVVRDLDSFPVTEGRES